jgi:photosystem II stability/assembly factor-like uncharacterized protein
MTHIYLAMEDELLVAEEQADGFGLQQHLHGHRPQCLAHDPRRPERVYCGTFDAGLWWSDDAGASWQPVGGILAGRAVTAVAVRNHASAQGSALIYVGTEPSALFCSSDGGMTWTELPALTTLPSARGWSFPPRPETHHVRWITLAPRDAQRVYACIEAGALIRSSDGGQSWRDRTPDGPRDTHTLVVHPNAPGRLYAAAGDGYFESVDGGDTWQRPDEGLHHHYFWSIAVDPADPEVRVASAAASAWRAHNAQVAESAVYRRTGAGPWQAAQAGLPSQPGTTVSSVVGYPAESGSFYLANNQGIYRSRDAGQSWHACSLPWPAQYRRQRVQVVDQLGMAGAR